MPTRGPAPRERRTSSRELATFGLLPEPEGRNKSFLVSLIINASIVALILILSVVMVHHQIVEKKQESLLLMPITPVKPAPPPVVRPHITITPPTPDLLNRTTPKFTYRPAPTETQPKLARVRMNAMSAPVLPPYRPENVALPPQPKVGTFATNIPTAVANNMGKTSTKTGGFGDPQGVHPNPNASKPATVAAVGSFSSAIGSASGAGAARKGKVGGVDFGSGYAHGVQGGGGHGKVASVGFNNGVARGAAMPRGKVVQNAFKDNAVTTKAPKMAIASTANETTVQVISHPRPEYTPEAKQLKIQGEVVLEVRFSADGRVHVIRVVRGLGHGLDQQAIRAAEQTIFKPATRDGKAVDITTYYRIDFQLA